jgi:hypothetical protein
MLVPSLTSGDSVSATTLDSLRTQSPDETTQAEIEALADQGQFLQAWGAARRFAPLASWRGEARLMASWLAEHLGAPGLSLRLRARAFRAAPRDLAARAAYANAVLERRRPLAAWSFLSSDEPSDEAPPEGRAELLLARARVVALLRDFESARGLLNEAHALAPQHLAYDWLRAMILELEDRTRMRLQYRAKRSPCIRAGGLRCN